MWLYVTYRQLSCIARASDQVLGGAGHDISDRLVVYVSCNKNDQSDHKISEDAALGAGFRIPRSTPCPRRGTELLFHAVLSCEHPDRLPARILRAERRATVHECSHYCWIPHLSDGIHDGRCVVVFGETFVDSGAVIQEEANNLESVSLCTSGCIEQGRTSAC